MKKKTNNKINFVNNCTVEGELQHARNEISSHSVLWAALNQANASGPQMKCSLREEQQALFKHQRRKWSLWPFKPQTDTQILFSVWFRFSLQDTVFKRQASFEEGLCTHTFWCQPLSFGDQELMKKIPENPIFSLLSERAKGRKVRVKMAIQQIRYSEWLGMTKGED